MKKRIFSLFVCTMLVFSFAVNGFAQEAQKEYTLSLADAVKMATENTPRFTSLDVKIADAQRQLERAKKDQRDLKGPIRLPAGISSVAVKQGYYINQAEIGLKSANMEKEQAQSSAAYNVTQKYFSVKLSESLLESARSAYALALENKNTMDTQLSLGLVSELDVKNAQYSLNSAKAAVDSYERSLALAKKSLCIDLQIDENSALNLTDGIEYEEFTSSVDEDTEKAFETRYDIYALKSVYEQAVSYRTVTEVLGLSSSEYSAANSNVIQTEYNYTNTKKLIALAIKSAYNDILNAKDSLNLAEESLELKEREYEVGKIQYGLGLITNTQLTAMMNSVSNARIERENAKLKYKLAVIKYGYDTAIGLPN